MKKILLSVFVIFCLPVMAEDEVYLDLNIPETHKFDTGALQYENKKLDSDDEEDYLKPSFSTIKKMFDEDFRSDEKTFNKNKQKLDYKLFKADTPDADIDTKRIPFDSEDKSNSRVNFNTDIRF